MTQRTTQEWVERAEEIVKRIESAGFTVTPIVKAGAIGFANYCVLRAISGQLEVLITEIQQGRS